MEIKGKIIAVLPAKSGTSAKTGNPWMSQSYVIETQEQYSHKCCFSVWGEDKIRLYGLAVGDEATVQFDIDAREYNGHWYNECRAYNVVKAQPAPTTYYTAQTPPPEPVQDKSDSLPF